MIYAGMGKRRHKAEADDQLQKAAMCWLYCRAVCAWGNEDVEVEGLLLRCSFQMSSINRKSCPAKTDLWGGGRWELSKLGVAISWHQLLLPRMPRLWTTYLGT